MQREDQTFEARTNRPRVNSSASYDDPIEMLLRSPPASKPSSRSRTRLWILSSVLFFILGVLITVRLPQAVAAMRGDVGWSWYAPIQDVHDALTALHADEMDQNKLQQGAINGMLESINDDYAEYIPPTDKDQFEKEMTGTYSGIGCEVESRDGWLTIASPMEGSPALLAGIMAGDRVIKIGDTSTYRLSMDECIKLLTGPEGTEVNFTVIRNGTEIPFSVTRKRIVSKSIRGVTRCSNPDDPNHSGSWQFLIDPADRIAYIRLSQFTPTAAVELEEAIQSAQDAAGDQGISGLILDLRENPGGSLDAAVSIADMFVSSGSIVSVRPRNGRQELYSAQEPDLFDDLPLLVMVDGNSASASEIVSGALQDHNKAVVLGSRTFGKGLVQQVFTLPHQKLGQIKFTIAKYYLPSGRLIQREDESTTWGVDPTPGFFAPESDEEIFDRLVRRREMDVLRQKSKSKTDQEVSADAVIEERWDDPAWIASQAKDKPLSMALEAMHKRLASGNWLPVTDQQAQTGKIAVKELADLRSQEKSLALELSRVAKRINALSHEAHDGKQVRETPDLWPDDLKLVDGVIEVKDKDGKIVAHLKITGRDLERWLSNADVEPIKTDITSAAQNQHPQTATEHVANPSMDAHSDEPSPTTQH